MPPTEPEDKTLPADPMSALAELAVQMHVLYSTFVAAGFTADQAMQFTLANWTEMVRFHLGRMPS